MTTRTDDCDDSSKTTTLAADTPTISGAPELAAAADSVPEPPAEHTEPEAEAEPDGAAVAAKADTPEAGIPEASIPEPAIPETSVPALSPATVASEPATVAPEVVSISRPVQPNAQSAPALAPPFLREHERRGIAARPAPTARRPAAPPPPAPKPTSRFPLLAATLALAAGLGAAAGAVGVSALVGAAPGSATAAAPPASHTAELDGLKAMVAQHAADLGALKASLEHNAKATATQYGKIAERLDRSERVQAEPTAKLVKIFEALERLEKRPAPAAADVTGSIHPPAPPAPEAKPKPVILEDYVLRRVFDGVALVEGRRGIIEVEPGATLPGAGRVEEIRRQDGRWVVVTNKGLIVPPR